MTDPLRIVHRAEEIRQAVGELAKAEAEALAVYLSQALDALMEAQRLGVDDVTLRGGPSTGTLERILKADGDIKLSTLVLAAAALRHRVRIEIVPLPAPDESRADPAA